MSEAKCETGWGDSLSTYAVSEWRDCHPTPLCIPLRSMHNDPPPPGEGKDHTAILRCSTGAPDVRLSAASMMALASMP